MKKIITIILILIFFTNCDRDFSPIVTKYFDPQYLPNLRLENLENFWQGDSITFRYNSVTAHFERHSGYLKALRSSVRGKGAIVVSVFKSRGDALNAMKFRIGNVAAIIRNGTSNEKIKDTWWYCFGLPPGIFISHSNTIIETGIIDYNYDKVKGLLIETALEISKRVEELSE